MNAKRMVTTLRWRMGQTTVEYLLTTLILVVFFSAMYGFMQPQIKNLFVQAGMVILRTYY